MTDALAGPAVAPELLAAPALVSGFLHVRAEYRGPRFTIRSVLRYTQLLSNSER